MKSGSEKPKSFTSNPILKGSLSLDESYLHYKETYTKRKNRYNKRTYKAIIKGFLGHMAKQLVNVGIVKLPASMGVLQILGTPTRMKMLPNGKMFSKINWGETLELWKEHPELEEKKQFVFYTNEHSNFNIYKVFWITKTNKIINKTRYKFRTGYNLRKMLSKKILSEDYSYLNRSVFNPTK